MAVRNSAPNRDADPQEDDEEHEWILHARGIELVASIRDAYGVAAIATGIAAR